MKLMSGPLSFMLGAKVLDKLNTDSISLLSCGMLWKVDRFGLSARFLIHFLARPTPSLMTGRSLSQGASFQKIGALFETDFSTLMFNGFV